MNGTDFTIPRSVAAGVSRLQRSQSERPYSSWFTQEIPNSYGFSRIASLAITGAQGAECAALQASTATFLRGHTATETPWAFILLGRPDQLEVYWGGSGSVESITTEFRSRYTAIFPGARLGDEVATGEFISGRLAGFSQMARFSGNPLPVFPSITPETVEVPPADSPVRVGLEALVRSMEGRSWAWLACGKPETEDGIEMRLQQYRLELQELQSAYLRKGTVEENNHPQARHYANLIEMAIRNHERGQHEGMWRTSGYLFTDHESALQGGAMTLQGILSHSSAGPEPVRITRCLSPHRLEILLTDSGTFLTSSEAAALATPPAESYVGFELRRVERFRPAPPRIGSGPRLAIGKVEGISGTTSHWFEVELGQLTGHTLIGGITGSGKTTTVQFLLRQLWREHGIPWLVIEPSAKCEYRQMLHEESGRDLRIYTAGIESISPLRLNPLSVPQGIPVQQHIDSLCSLFSAAFSWVTPMPYVLSAAMHRLYEDFGWDLVGATGSDSGPPGRNPTLRDLIPIVEIVAMECGYDREVTANVTAGIKTRINSLLRGGKGHLFASQVDHAISDLLRKPTVIELSALGDDDEKAFLMGVFVLKIAQYRQSQGMSRGKLRHALVIEEAHRLLAEVSSGGGIDMAEARSKSIELFCNLMAEVRAFGQGLVAVDQIPGKLASEVIRNTNLKIMHRLPAAADRDVVGGAMALDEGQIRELARLCNGEAITHSSGPEDASRVRVPRRPSQDDVDEVLVSSPDVKTHMAPWFLPYSPGSSQTTDTEKSAPVSSVLPHCRGCETGHCDLQKSALNALANQNYSAALREAANEGWDALWKFGTHVAEGNHPGSPACRTPKLTFCILMNLASLAGWDNNTIDRLRRNLLILLRQNTPLSINDEH